MQHAAGRAGASTSIAHATRRSRQRLALLALLLAALLSSACSTTTERLAGWYVTRKIDSYLDLDGQQKKVVRERVDAHLTRLRQHELPRWLFVLRETRDTLQSGATEAKLESLQQRYDRLFDEAALQLIPDLALTLSELRDAQIDHFTRRLRENQDKAYDERDMSPEQRRKDTDEHVFEAIEGLVGDLNDEQKRAISKLVQAMPDERPIRYEVERRRIAAAGKFLRGHPGAPAIAAELERLWRTRYEELGKGRDLVTRRREQRSFLLSLDALLTPEQRAEGVENLNKLIRRAKKLVLPTG